MSSNNKRYINLTALSSLWTVFIQGKNEDIKLDEEIKKIIDELK